jgi:hypothetical protein
MKLPKYPIEMKIVFLLLSLIGTHAWAEPTKFDLRERIQFVLTGDKGDEVRFEYCKLAVCKPIVDKNYTTEQLTSIVGGNLLPSGVALQLVTDASTNRLIKPDITFSVGGVIPSDKGHFAICKDKNIPAMLNEKNKPADFIIKYDISKCPQVRNADRSIKSEANLLNVALEKINKH